MLQIYLLQLTMLFLKPHFVWLNKSVEIKDRKNTNHNELHNYSMMLDDTCVLRRERLERPNNWLSAEQILLPKVSYIGLHHFDLNNPYFLDHHLKKPKGCTIQFGIDILFYYHIHSIPIANNVLRHVHHRYNRSYHHKSHANQDKHRNLFSNYLYDCIVHGNNTTSYNKFLVYRWKISL